MSTIKYYHQQIKQNVDIDSFRLQVIAYMDTQGVDEQNACKKLVDKYRQKTFTKYNISELSTEVQNGPVAIVATLRNVYPVKQYNFKKIMYAIFCDSTGLITAKFEQQSIDELLPYVSGQTLRIKGFVKNFGNNRTILQNVTTIQFVSDTALYPPITPLYKATPESVFDAYIKLVFVHRSLDRRPHLLLVADDKYSYLIKSWNSSVLDLIPGTYYRLQNVRANTQYKGIKDWSLGSDAMFIQDDKEIIGSSIEKIYTVLDENTVNFAIVCSYQLTVTDASIINYERGGVEKTSKKYVLQTENNETSFSFVDWDGKFFEKELNINSTVILRNVLCTKKYTNYELKTTEFTSVSY